MIDETKLAALRARFVNGRPDEIQDPDFRKATALGFHDADRRALPFSGISTF